jgi:hypothetical protein
MNFQLALHFKQSGFPIAAPMAADAFTQGDTMDQRFLLKAVTAGVILALAGCGGGGDSSSSSSSGGAATRAYTLPTEISAVPASTSVAASLRGASLLGRLDRAAANLSSTSDYSQALTSKYVEEHALEQFDIIEQVMSALSQTHYNDSANQNGVAYKSMVAWEDENNGVSVKNLEPWVVKSEIVSGLHPDGSTGNLNRVQAWIEEDDQNNPGQKKVIRAEFKIYSGATFDTDGTVLSYGEWDLNVAFDNNAAKFFVATSRNNNGTPELKINEDEGEWFSRAVLYRTGNSGYGKVEYPDFSGCQTQNCTPATGSAAYAYNADYLVIDDGSGPVYKDRSSEVEMTHCYDLFYAAADAGDPNTASDDIAAGDNVQKHKSFGFPVSYTDGNGANQHAYYGAWQGRHQLWGPNGGSVPAGTVVTREDFGANATPTTYTVQAPLAGSFTKRMLVAGNPNDIKDIVVETFTNKHFELFNDNGTWMTCEGGWVDFNAPLSSRCVSFQTNVGGPLVAFNQWDTLKGDSRKFVNIGRWDNINQIPINYVYLAAADGVVTFTTAGFYPATQGPNGITPVNGGNLYAGANGDQIGIDIGGSLYIQYTGDFANGATGWVQKKLTAFDQSTWTPTFDANGDVAFDPEQGREYYINSNGVNYAVQRIAAADAAASYEVQLELQSTANPVNVASFLPVGTHHLGTPWQPGLELKLETNSGSANFLKLVYNADDPATNTVETTADVYTSGQWGLQAFDANGAPLDVNGAVVTVDGFGVPTGGTRPVQFNWEYSADGGWGSQQYLKSGGNYVLLSDPISLAAQSYSYSYNTGTKSLALQFDGWMHGLPDLYRDLQKEAWAMTTALSQKIINIPAGTEVVDSNGIHYYIKPLQVSIFLAEVNTPATGKTFPLVTQASALDVSPGSPLLPAFTNHGMSTTIPTAEVRYSEGNEV